MHYAGTGTRICEVGAGAAPLLPPRDGYVLLDISPKELDKAGGGYETIVTDICSKSFTPRDQFHLVFSLSTAEHIRDPESFHRNVRRMLFSGGIAVHFFPTLYAAPFVLNRLIGERVGEWIVVKMNPLRASSGQHGKFPALYRWCRGPSVRQINRLESCGFEVVEYRGYYGHNYYQPLRFEWATRPVWRWLERHPVPALTSYALVVLRAV